MSDFVRNIAIGFSVAALLVAAGEFDPGTARASGRPAPIAEAAEQSAEVRDEYRSDMEQQIDEASDRMGALAEDAADATDEQIGSLESAWDAVETRWAELSDVADENWSQAQAELDKAWNEFQLAWKDAFGDEAQQENKITN